MTQSKELTERSPLRVLDRSIHGGLREPWCGLRGAGAGKSAFLVAVALDHLLAGRQVLHVALDHPVDRVRDYYDEIFRAAQQPAWRTCRARVRRSSATGASMSSPAHVLRGAPGADAAALRAARGQHPACLVVDGYDFEHGSWRR